MSELPLFAHARRSDPDTSKTAARSVGKVKELQERILVLFEAFGPMTDPAMERRYQGRVALGMWPVASPQNLRSRRAELCKGEKPLVHDTLKRELGPSGRPFVVWGLTK